jgi:hypothetical protein
MPPVATLGRAIGAAACRSRLGELACRRKRTALGPPMSVAAAPAVGPATPPLCLPPPRSPTSARPLLDGEPISPQGALPSASWNPARLHVLLLLRLLAVDPPGALRYLRYPCGRRRRPGHLGRPNRRSLAAAPGSRSLAAAPGRRSMAAAPGSRPWQPPLAADSGCRPWPPTLGHLAVADRLLWPPWLGRPGRRCLATLAAAARPPWQTLPGHPGRRSPATLAARLGASCAAAGPPLAACPRRRVAAHHAPDGHAAASAGHAPLGRQAPRD